MLRGRGIDVGTDRALVAAADVNRLPIADSLIDATAQRHGALLWTQDNPFDGLPGVRLFPKG